MERTPSLIKCQWVHVLDGVRALMHRQNCNRCHQIEQCSIKWLERYCDCIEKAPRLPEENEQTLMSLPLINVPSSSISYIVQWYIVYIKSV